MPDQQSDFFAILKRGGRRRPSARNFALALLAALILVVAGTSASNASAGQGRQPKQRPTPTPSARLNVTISSDAPETDIYIPEGEKIGTTDKEGKLVVRLPPGSYKGKTKKQGHADRQFTITVSPAQTTVRALVGDALPRPTPTPSPTPAADVGDAVAAGVLIKRFSDPKQTGQIKQDDWKNFLKVTYQDLAREPNSAELNARAQFALGQIALLDGNNADAQHAFNSALRYVPGYALAAYGLGNTYLATNPAAAIKEYQRALTADPKLGMAYKGLGDAWRALKKEKEAREAYVRAGELGFLSRDVRLDLARTLVDHEKWTEAIAALKTLAAEEPAARDNGVVYMLLGDCYKKLNQKRNAFDHYKEAVSRDDGLARAHYMIGEFEFEEKNWDKARDAYNKALNLAPGDKEIANRAKQRAREADEKLLKLKNRLP